MSSVLFLVQVSEKRKEKFPSSVHFSPLLPWHSALAWQPFMPKKYFGSARSPGIRAAGSGSSGGSEHRVPLSGAPVCPTCEIPRALTGTEHLLFLVSSCTGTCMTAGETHFTGDMRAVLPQVPEIRSAPPCPRKPCCDPDSP